MSIALALCAAIAPVSAQAVIKNYELNIPRQSLDTALKAFASQTGLQVARFADTVDGSAIVGPLSGTYSTDEALKSLLDSSGLTYRLVNERTIAVTKPEETVREKNPELSKTTTAVGVRKNDHMRLAQADTAPQSPSADQGMKEVELDEVIVRIPEVLVVGSRSLNTDIQRTEDDPQPYVIFDKEEIERSHSINLEEFLKRRLPMNTVGNTTSQNSGQSNQSTFDLRGLGPNQTLILVDGRRMPRVSDSGNFAQADINGIPLSAVERIEVLPSTASGIYGGGATGGVINVILRRDYKGANVNLRYGNSFRSDVSNRAVDFNAGFTLEGGATRVMLAGSYSDASPLLTGERDFAARARALQFSNNPTAFFNLTSPPTGYTSNVRNASPNQNANLVLKPEFGGTILSSPRTYVPVGYTGPSSDNAAALVANAGQYNLALPETVTGARTSLLNDPTIRSGLFNVRRSFGSRVEGFIDFFWLDNHGHNFSASIPNSITLPVSAPNNPFTTAVIVRFPATGLSAPVESESQTLRATGGAILRLPYDWSAALDYTWSRSRSSNFGNTAIVGDPDGPGPASSPTAALANGTLNVMRDLNAQPLDFTPYLLATPNALTGPSDNVFGDAVLRLSGPILQLPGGPLVLASSFEHRNEKAEDMYSELRQFDAVTFYPAREQSVNSLYVETNVPVISARNSPSLVRALEIQASVRRDEYETTSPAPSFLNGRTVAGPFPEFSSVTNDVNATKYTLALRYSPVDDIVLRASRGTGFLPPSVSQLQGAFFPGITFNVIDPKRGNVLNTIIASQTTGGNTGLRPEESESWSVGLVFTPRSIPNLRLSLDYTNIRKSDEITVLQAQTLLNLEDAFAGRVIRDPLSPADAALGYTGGEITGFDNSLINAQETALEAYDLQLDYDVSTQRFGKFRFYTVVTMQPTFERKASPNAAAFESVGYNGGPLRWRGNAGFVWDRGPLSLGWNTEYFQSHFILGGFLRGNRRGADAIAGIRHRSKTDLQRPLRFMEIRRRGFAGGHGNIALGPERLRRGAAGHRDNRPDGWI